MEHIIAKFNPTLHFESKHISNNPEILLELYDLPDMSSEYMEETIIGQTVTSVVEAHIETPLTLSNVVIFPDGTWMNEQEYNIIKDLPVNEAYQFWYVNGLSSPHNGRGQISASMEPGYKFWFEYI